MLDISALKEKAEKLLRLDKKKKARLKRVLPSTIALAVIVAMVLITVYHSTDGFTTIVDVEYASLVSESNSMSFTAYTLKDEEPLTSPYPNGGILYEADNGQRMDAGDELLKVYEAPVEASVEKSLAYLDSVIEILEKSVEDGSFTLGDSKEVKDGIQTLYYKMTGAINSGDTSVISAYANELLVLLNKVQSYAGHKDEIENVLDEYKNRRKEYEKYYSGKYVSLNAKEGGYYFRNTDGYESIYTSANIDDLTYGSFIEMTEKEPVEAGKVGKLLKNYKWYLVIPTVTGISDTYTVGAYYDIFFPDSGNRSFKMTLDRVASDESGAKTLMIFSCGVVDGSFDYLRIQRVNIVSRDITGYRIPEKVVCELNGTTGVYILKDGKATFRKIVILYKGDGYYIVSADKANSDDYYVYVELNDSIIIDSKNMYEGKVIE